MDWGIILQNISIFTIGTVSITGILAWLGRELFRKWIESKIEAYKFELLKSSEEHKAQLQRITNEHQIRYSKLHNDRAMAIKEVYTNLYKMELSMSDFICPLTLAGDAPKSEKGRIAAENVNSFSSFYYENKIYFDKSICELIEEIIGIVKEVWGDFTAYDLHLEKLSENFEFRKEQRKIWNESWKKIRDVVPQLKAKLEDEFRKLLGVC